jgi:hypothetical protein
MTDAQRVTPASELEPTAAETASALEHVLKHGADVDTGAWVQRAVELLRRPSHSPSADAGDAEALRAEIARLRDSETRGWKLAQSLCDHPNWHEHPPDLDVGFYGYRQCAECGLQASLDGNDDAPSRLQVDVRDAERDSLQRRVEELERELRAMVSRCGLCGGTSRVMCDDGHGNNCWGECPDCYPARAALASDSKEGR